ncbi:FGGY-family carbohydrate kinase [Streptomyces montanisoli]|uniref:Carbohydrate kinase n=1 Tax=Streptomyces montanisoli TaxID=2798581 RepID=A0A940MD82_9ACTN|nr:FGGY family carbohydrate kinase [Streptomyces montanisoli]MBP0458758.1 carbohydrate kinase [Streptomyces montanisoli]
MATADDDGVWLGIDLGTQSVRALAVASGGRVRGQGSAPLTGTRDGKRHEQLPADWWSATVDAVRQAVRGLAAPVDALAVCGTSGTVLLTDAKGEPVSPALMYDDGRAVQESRRAQEAGEELWRELGQRIQPSWALAKLVWLTEDGDSGSGSGPQTGAQAGARVCHQADFVTSRLVGRPVATDSSHALKSGYDTRRRAWPVDVLDALGLGGLTFPDVVLPGNVLGTVGAAAAKETGLSPSTRVIAGMTDGCAAQLGSGAWEVGRWNSVLGTTLVIKGVTAEPLHDPAGVLYNHLSPDSTWLPGGASSAGAGVLTTAFPGADLPALDRAAAAREPAGAITYPLVSRGERFPFLAPDAELFTLGTPADDADRYASLLQGVALVERLCLAYVRQLGARVEGPVAFTGGATRSAYWNQLRADVLGRPATVPEGAGSALGMAVLAARGAGVPRDTLRSMVRVAEEVAPRDAVKERFDGVFVALVDELARRGWLPEETARYAREEG